MQTGFVQMQKGEKMAKYIVEIADEIEKDSALVPFDMCRPSWWEEAYKQGMAEVESRIIHCRDCKWWEKKEYGPYGYCHAIKHRYYSRHWEINIHRTYEEDFYCADAELRTEEEEGEDD